MSQPHTHDVLDFCAQHKVSRALLYKLWREGKGPAVMKVGRRTLISAEAAAEWRQRMTKATGPEAA